MIHHPPSPPPMPAATVTVNTAYFDSNSQNAFVNLRGIRGTVFIDYCQGRAMHIAISKKPGEEYGTVILTCKGETQSKPFYLK